MRSCDVSVHTHDACAFTTARSLMRIDACAAACMNMHSRAYTHVRTYIDKRNDASLKCKQGFTVRNTANSTRVYREHISLAGTFVRYSAYLRT
jgi:hypothetical protein